ncbi:unnamed protein product [Cylindrotheca closterium]|uniref:Uncharacterized protein n=1 Tax=Cylindrotheca closterium TaxID=2856 RepID=A0AAD2CKQ4_9STRA|nr:unnamed protein product [Cylindrotheca closterium]
MNDEEKRASKEDCAESTNEQPMFRYHFKKGELAEKLQALGKAINGNKADLQKRCTDNGIAISEMRMKIKQGWENKPKGMLQVLWERGFIDTAVPKSELWKKYPEKGQKDNLGLVMPGTALKEMVADLPDFQDEKTLLQYHAEGRSTAGCQIMFIRSPKCHPEIAGEGIEYDWAGIKSYYRRSDLASKKTLEAFKALVKESMESVQFNHRASFSARAREYMLAYDVLEEWNNLPEELKNGDPEKEKLPKTSAQFLDRIVNCRWKRHRDVGADEGWVNLIMNAMKKREVIVID